MDSRSGASNSFTHSVHANQKQLWFTFTGDEVSVIKHVRELFYQFLEDKNCTWVKDVRSTSKPDDPIVSYSIYMDNNNVDAMETVFWYLGKKLGKLPEVNFSFLKFTDILVQLKNNESSSLTKCLLNALCSANLRNHEPFIIRDDVYIPRMIWTRDEHIEDDKIKAQIDSFKCGIDALPETSFYGPQLNWLAALFKDPMKNILATKADVDETACISQSVSGAGSTSKCRK